MEIIAWLARGEGGGGTTLYKPYRYVPAAGPKSWAFGPFWFENGYHFARFGLESGMVFEGTTEAYEQNHRFNSK